MLDELSKDHNTWLKYATKICGCSNYAQDLVNDMYLKIYDSKPKRVNKGYIYNTIKSIFVDHKRQQKDFVSQLPELASDEDNTLEMRYECLEMLKDVGLIRKTVLLETHEYSLRKASQMMNVNYNTLNYQKQKGLKKLRNKYGRNKR